MQVWELMKELSEYPAGCEVYVSDSPEGWMNSVNTVNQDEDAVMIRGGGVATADCSND